MRIVYCAVCNNFTCSNRIKNHCTKCKAAVREVPMSFEKYSALSINERYRLAYLLTNKYEQTYEQLINSEK